MTDNLRTRQEFDRVLASSALLVERLQAALRQHDRAAIVELIGQLVERRAPLGNQWRQLADIAANHGEVTLARAAIDLFVEATGRSKAALFQKFDLLARVGALAEASTLLDSLPQDVPEPGMNAYSRGAVALYLGEAEEARQWLDAATAVRPSLGQAWLALSMLVNFAEEQDLKRRILAAEGEIVCLAPDQQASYYYALGKAKADLADQAAAFTAFDRAAQLKKSQVRYDRELVAANAREAMRGYSAKGIAEIARRQKEPTGRAIFVTGMPRSGTTLVEQILTSHSAVWDGSEIDLLRLLRQDVGGLGYSSVAKHIAEHGTGHIARLWQHLLEERFPAPGRVVDKSTDTGFFLGIVSALLPDAPLIWVKRNPLDCAWSCFRTHFFAGLEWTYDLEDIAFHFRLADRLLAHWQEVLGDRLLVVPYEELVAQPENWIRRIMAHCGLEEEPQVFTPHLTRRTVNTSSVMQVRQPINRKGIGAAEPYREFLEPFLAAYSD